MESAVLEIDPHAYRPSALHDPSRHWPETNCYVDLWIELLAALGFEPAAMLGFTVAQDFEGDQFTFFKVPLEDLEALYGVATGIIGLETAVFRFFLPTLAGNVFGGTVLFSVLSYAQEREEIYADPSES